MGVRGRSPVNFFKIIIKAFILVFALKANNICEGTHRKFLLTDKNFGECVPHSFSDRAPKILSNKDHIALYRMNCQCGFTNAKNKRS